MPGVSQLQSAYPRMLAVKVCTYVYLGLFLLIRVVFWILSLRYKKAEDHEGWRGRVVLYGSIALVIAVGVFTSVMGDKLPDWLKPTFPLAVKWVGIALGFLACALFLWVHLHLGKSWSGEVSLMEDHELVTSGPYTYVGRHPMYTCLAIFFIAISLNSADILLMAAFIIHYGCIAGRIGTEERIMLRTFGDQYVQYKRRTGAFLPVRFPCCDCGVSMANAEKLVRQTQSLRLDESKPSDELLEA